jgi:hypothetical protein
MQDPLADAGVIRKLWIGEAARYRDHLLRLDQDSRHSRFGGGVSDDFIRDYVRTTFGLGSVVHGFSPMERCAARPNCARWDALSPGRPRRP